MKTRVILAAVLVVLLALPLAVYAQEVEPEVEVEAFVNAINEGNAAEAGEKVAEDAVVEAPEEMAGSAVGKAEVEAWIESLMSANGQTTLGECVVEGQIVTCDATFTSDKLTGMGITEIEGELEIEVNAEGKIQAYAFTPTAESAAALQAADAATPETIAVTGGASLPPNALVTIVGGLMVAGALGMQALKRRGR